MLNINRRPVLAVFAVVAFLAFACGGGNDEAQENGDSTPTAADTAPAGQESPTRAVSSSPVGGPLVFVSGLGLFAVNSADGSGSKFEFTDVEDSLVGVAPAISDGVAYALTFVPVEGQSYSNEVYISRVDLTSGQNERLTRVGFDRETDDAQEVFQYTHVAFAAGDAWVIRGQFGVPRSRELIRVDGTSGEIEATIPVPSIATVVSDGLVLYIWTAEGLQALDAVTETLETLLPGGTKIRDIIAPDVDIEPAFLTESDDPLTGDDLEFASGQSIDGSSVGAGLGSSGTPLHFLAVGDGAVWMNWAAAIGTAAGETALGEAILRFDLATRRIDAIVPTVHFGIHFLDDGWVSNGGGDLMWEGGVLWATDPQANGAIIRLDPASLQAAIAHQPCGHDVDCFNQDSVLFNRTDPGAVWIQFSRLRSQGDGSSSGEIFLNQLEPTTGGLIQEIPFADLLPEGMR